MPSWLQKMTSSIPSGDPAPASGLECLVIRIMFWSYLLFHNFGFNQYDIYDLVYNLLLNAATNLAVK